MPWEAGDLRDAYDALRVAVARALLAERPALAGADGLLLAEAATHGGVRRGSRTSPLGPAPAADSAIVAETDSPAPSGEPGAEGDTEELPTSSEHSEEERSRLIALVELARKGDADAFGMLYDHYHTAVYRFLYYRTRSMTLAEDLTSDTFFRALRSMANFRWQGKDFGAWLMTIARNLAADHFKAGRTRLEMATEDMGQHDDTTEGPEPQVMASITNEILHDALGQIPAEQRDCIIMRFLQGMSIAETAAALGRSDGAVKQLQLRGVRNLAKLMPDGLRG